MKAYLVRHAVPEDTEDPDRELTPEGVDIVKALAQWMADNDEVPDSIITSPAVRTQQTAEILADELGLQKSTIDVTIGPNESVRGLIRRTAEDKSNKRVCIVSHHESFEHGLRELNRDPWVHLDMMAMGEMRIMKIKRKNGEWKEIDRALPSKFGLVDHY